MLRPRIIPCLLVQNRGLVKTINFKSPKYVGDPINAVKIFNEKESDELMLIDIDASQENREPDYHMIESVAAECRMPLCYGGGIKTPFQAKKILGLGVEKIAISSAIVEQPDLVRDLARQVGSQSVVAVVDIKRGLLGRHDIYIRNATLKLKIKLHQLVDELQKAGVGEIVINSIDRDGCMKGYDLNLAKEIRSRVEVPLTVLGGAGSLDDIKHLVNNCGIVGCAAGSLFVFKGKYRAVLINYPNPVEKRQIFETC
jgi:cyclase